MNSNYHNSIYIYVNIALLYSPDLYQATIPCILYIILYSPDLYQASWWAAEA